VPTVIIFNSYYINLDAPATRVAHTVGEDVFV